MKPQGERALKATRAAWAASSTQQRQGRKTLKAAGPPFRHWLSDITLLAGKSAPCRQFLGPITGPAGASRPWSHQLAIRQAI